jgi:hypothetical protein
MMRSMLAFALMAFAAGQQTCESNQVSTQEYGCVGVDDLDPLSRSVCSAALSADAAECEANTNITARSMEWLSNRSPLDRLELNMYLPCEGYQALNDVDTSRDKNIAPQMDGVTESECYDACSKNPSCNVAVHKDTSCWLKATGVAADTVEYRLGFNSLYKCEDAEVLKELIQIKLSMNDIVGCEGHRALEDATIVEVETLGPIMQDTSADECWQACEDYVPKAGEAMCEAAVFANSRCILKAASVLDPSTMYAPGTQVLYPCI